MLANTLASPGVITGWSESGLTAIGSLSEADIVPPATSRSMTAQHTWRTQSQDVESVERVHVAAAPEHAYQEGGAGSEPATLPIFGPPTLTPRASG
jgi:hypothetical protein